MLSKKELLYLCALYCVAATSGMGFLRSGQAAELVTGVNPKWARGVVERAPTQAHDGTRPRAPLYFWMIYEGREAALEYIRKNGTLPIYHKWSVRIAGKLELERPDQLYTEKITIPLAVGDKARKNLLALEDSLKNAGKFQWRTWSMKKYVSKGQWKVEVLYEEDGQPVQCEDQGQLKPCVYTIEIR